MDLQNLTKSFVAFLENLNLIVDLYFQMYSLKLQKAAVCSFCNVAQQLHELQIRLDFHQNKRDTTPIFFSCFALKIMQSRNEIDIWTLKCMSTLHSGAMQTTMIMMISHLDIEYVAYTTFMQCEQSSIQLPVLLIFRSSLGF